MSKRLGWNMNLFLGEMVCFSRRKSARPANATKIELFDRREEGRNDLGIRDLCAKPWMRYPHLLVPLVDNAHVETVSMRSRAAQRGGERIVKFRLKCCKRFSTPR